MIQQFSVSLEYSSCTKTKICELTWNPINLAVSGEQLGFGKKSHHSTYTISVYIWSCLPGIRAVWLFSVNSKPQNVAALHSELRGTDPMTNKGLPCIFTCLQILTFYLLLVSPCNLCFVYSHDHILPIPVHHCSQHAFIYPSLSWLFFSVPTHVMNTCSL